MTHPRQWLHRQRSMIRARRPGGKDTPPPRQTRRWLSRWLVLLMLVGIGIPPVLATPTGPAIVLVTQALPDSRANVREALEGKLRQRFPGHEVRWAVLPGSEAAPEPATGLPHPPPLPQVLVELKDAGQTRVVVQPLSLLPGVAEAELLAPVHKTPGLNIAWGKPLLGSLPDRQRFLTTLSQIFTPGKDQAVFIVGTGSKNPAILREYLALYTLLLAKFKDKNLFLGTSHALPEIKTALAAVKKASANNVTIVPLPDYLDKSASPQLLAAAAACQQELSGIVSGKITVWQEDLGAHDGILSIYGDHVAAALETLAPKKPERKKRGRK